MGGRKAIVMEKKLSPKGRRNIGLHLILYKVLAMAVYSSVGRTSGWRKSQAKVCINRSVAVTPESRRFESFYADALSC